MELDSPLTVGVSCYNGRRFLDECLKSLLDQDFDGPYEILVVDNASTDGSAEYVRRHYPQVRVERIEPPNIGFTGAVNRVMLASRSRYFCAVNVDTVFHRRWLAEMLQAMIGNPNTGMAQSNAILPWWPEFPAQEREQPVERAYVCDVTSLGIHDYRAIPVTPGTQPVRTLGGNGAALMFNRTIVEKLGYLMDTDYFCYAEDLDCALRINAAGFRVLFVPKATVYHNSAWQAKPDRRTLEKAILSTRNTFLTFFKVCYWHEFALLVPLLVLGNLQKARQHALSRWLQWIFVMAVIPQTLLAMVQAVVMMPRFRAKRRAVLAHRVGDQWWLVRRMLKQRWQLGSEVWILQPSAGQQRQVGSSIAR